LAINALLRKLDQFYNKYLNSLFLFDKNLGAQFFIPRQDTNTLKDPELMRI